MDAGAKAGTCWAISLLHAFLGIELGADQPIGSEEDWAADGMRGVEQRNKDAQSWASIQASQNRRTLDLIISVAQIQAHNYPVRVLLQQRAHAENDKADAAWCPHCHLLRPEMVGQSRLHVAHQSSVDCSSNAFSDADGSHIWGLMDRRRSTFDRGLQLHR
eukprot:12405397-Karenia_brevis.AAC.1